MDDDELQRIASQLSCPSGETAVALGERVSSTNAFMIERCIETLRLAVVLDEMWNQDAKNYHVLLRFVGFFETVGLMVKKGYVPVDDIDDLFRGTEPICIDGRTGSINTIGCRCIQ